MILVVFHDAAKGLTLVAGGCYPERLMNDQHEKRVEKALQAIAGNLQLIVRHLGRIATALEEQDQALVPTRQVPHASAPTEEKQP